jgi:hypothetical protein
MCLEKDTKLIFIMIGFEMAMGKVDGFVAGVFVGLLGGVVVAFALLGLLDYCCFAASGANYQHMSCSRKVKAFTLCL